MAAPAAVQLSGSSTRIDGSVARSPGTTVPRYSGCTNTSAMPSNAATGRSGCASSGCAARRDHRPTDSSTPTAMATASATTIITPNLLIG